MQFIYIKIRKRNTGICKKAWSIVDEVTPYRKNNTDRMVKEWLTKHSLEF
jgi:hypothetical protein